MGLCSPKKWFFSALNHLFGHQVCTELEPIEGTEKYQILQGTYSWFKSKTNTQKQTRKWYKTIEYLCHKTVRSVATQKGGNQWGLDKLGNIHGKDGNWNVNGGYWIEHSKKDGKFIPWKCTMKREHEVKKKRKKVCIRIWTPKLW